MVIRPAIVFVFLFSFCQIAGAGIYKCKVADQILYSQIPCAPGADSQIIKHIRSSRSAKSTTVKRSREVVPTENSNQFQQNTPIYEDQTSDADRKLASQSSFFNQGQQNTSNDENQTRYIERKFDSESQYVEQMFSRKKILDHVERMDSGKESFKLVLDDIYDEMGRPDFTEAFAKKFDRLIFSRKDLQAPRFEPDVGISWLTFSGRVSALISCCYVNNKHKTVNVIWRPDQELEIVDP